MSDKSVSERIQYRKENAVQPEPFLENEANAIQPTEGEEQLELTPEFEDTLQEYIDQYQESGVEEADLARLFEVDEDDVTEKDRPYVAYKIIHTIRDWPSEGALVYDIAVDAALREMTDRWDDVPPRQRYRIAQSLRTFQDECLFCGGRIDFSDEMVESCCTERQVVTLHCEECDRRLLEFASEQESSFGASGM